MSVRVLTRKEFRDLDFCPCRNPEDLKDMGIIFIYPSLRRPAIEKDSNGNVSPSQFIGENQLNFDVSEETRLAIDSNSVCDSHSGNYSSQWESNEFVSFSSGVFPSRRINGSLNYTSENESVEHQDIKYLQGVKERRVPDIIPPSTLIYDNWGEEVITRSINYSERVETWDEFDHEIYKDFDVTITITTKPDGTYELRRKGYRIIIVSNERERVDINEVEPFFWNGTFGRFTEVTAIFETRKPTRRNRPDYNIDLENFSIDYLDHKITSNYSLNISRDFENGGSFARNENWSVSSSTNLPIRVQFEVRLHDQDTLKNHPGEPRPVEVELFYADFFGFGEFTLSHGQSTSGEIYNLDTPELQEAFDLIYLENNRGIISVLNREPSTKNNTIITFNYGYSHIRFNSHLDFVLGRVSTMFSEDWIALSEFITYSPLLEESNETLFNDDFNRGINRTYISPVYELEPLVKLGQNLDRVHEWGDERLEGMVF